MSNKIWVVVCDSCYDYLNDIDVKLFENKKSALEYAQQRFNEEKVEYHDNYDEDEIREDVGELYFRIWEYGRYGGEHFVVKIIESEITR